MKEYQVLWQIVFQKIWQGCQPLRSSAFPPKPMAGRHRGKQKDFPQAKLPPEPVKLFLFLFFFVVVMISFQTFGRRNWKLSQSQWIRMRIYIKNCCVCCLKLHWLWRELSRGLLHHRLDSSLLSQRNTNVFFHLCHVAENSRVSQCDGNRTCCTHSHANLKITNLFN